MARQLALAAVSIAMLGLSGCASFPPGQTRPSDLFAAARHSEKAPEGFNDGVARSSCGDVTLAQGKEFPAEPVPCRSAAIHTANTGLACREN